VNLLKLCVTLGTIKYVPFSYARAANAMSFAVC
jgi:hypothetical protein